MPQLEIEIVGTDDDDAERVEELAGHLRRELAALDVERVERPIGGIAPAGSKSGAASEIGKLLVDVSPVVMPVVIATVQGWVARPGQRRVRMKLGDDEIDIDGDVLDDEKRALISAFLSRHKE